MVVVYVKFAPSVAVQLQPVNFVGVIGVFSSLAYEPIPIHRPKASEPIRPPKAPWVVTKKKRQPGFHMCMSWEYVVYNLCT